MPMIVFQPQTRINSADVNANFANTLALDTPRTVVVTHTWAARQQFNNGITVAGAIEGGSLTVSGRLTAGGEITTRDRLRVNDDGSAARTAIGWSTGAGFYNIGASIGVAIGAAERLRITTSQIVAPGGMTFVGNGSGLTNLNASRLTSGSVPPARLDSIPAGNLTGTVPNARISGNYNGINTLSVGVLNVGGGSNIVRIRTAQANVNFGNIGEGSSTSVVATAFGTFAGNAVVLPCIAGPPVAPPRGLQISVSLIAADSVRLSVYNGGPGTWDGSNTAVRLLIIEPTSI